MNKTWGTQLKKQGRTRKDRVHILEDLPEAMDDRDEWREREREIVSGISVI